MKKLIEAKSKPMKLPREHVYHDVVVLNVDEVPDSLGETLDIKGIVKPNSPIPVFATGDFDAYLKPEHLLGTAVLFWSEPKVARRHQVLATLYLRASAAGKTPAIMGTIHAKGKTKKGVIRHCTLTGVLLVVGKNCDHRIKALRGPGGRS
jgi:hypothetical protein